MKWQYDHYEKEYNHLYKKGPRKKKLTKMPLKPEERNRGRKLNHRPKK